jgi:hypothetical protein
MASHALAMRSRFRRHWGSARASSLVGSESPLYSGPEALSSKLLSTCDFLSGSVRVRSTGAFPNSQYNIDSTCRSLHCPISALLRVSFPGHATCQAFSSMKSLLSPEIERIQQRRARLRKALSILRGACNRSLSGRTAAPFLSH